jgi:hypothetical protein
MKTVKHKLWFAAPVLLVAAALSMGQASAQNYGSSGSGWSGSWGFGQAGDRSVNLQTAQSVLAARNRGPQSVITYDNRTNYVEYDAAAGSSFVSDFHIGDTSTNTIGAMNTGETSITVEGENNVVTASSIADSIGCQDGTIISNTLGSPNLPVSFGTAVPGSNAALGAVPSTAGC